MVRADNMRREKKAGLPVGSLWQWSRGSVDNKRWNIEFCIILREYTSDNDDIVYLVEVLVTHSGSHIPKKECRAKANFLHGRAWQRIA